MHEDKQGNGRGEREVNEGVTVSIGCQLTRGRKGEGEAQ